MKHETHRQRKPTIKSCAFASRFANENKNAQKGTDFAVFLTPLSNLSSLTRVDLLARITKNYPSSVFASENGVSFALFFGPKNTADICCRFIFVVPYEKKGGCVQIAKDPNLQKCQFVHLWLYINDKLFFSTSSFFPILNKNAPSPYIYKVLNTTASALSRYKNDELCSKRTVSVLCLN